MELCCFGRGRKFWVTLAFFDAASEEPQENIEKNPRNFWPHNFLFCKGLYTQSITRGIFFILEVDYNMRQTKSSGCLGNAMTRKQVLIFCGGQSSEHEVSLRSAA